MEREANTPPLPANTGIELAYLLHRQDSLPIVYSYKALLFEDIMNKILLFLVMVVGLTGCATTQFIDDSNNIDLAGQPTFYRNQWVRLSPAEILIEPAHEASYAPKVLFIPFRVTQDMENARTAGYSAGRTVWQTWTSMRLFPSMEFTGDPTPYRRDVALMQARKRGADMVVGGFVTYLYPGGTAGETQIALQVEAIDAHSGQVVWSLSQAASMPASTKKDYLLFAVREKMPSDPLYACTRSIAQDLGRYVQRWVNDADDINAVGL